MWCSRGSWRLLLALSLGVACDDREDRVDDEGRNEGAAPAMQAAAAGGVGGSPSAGGAGPGSSGRGEVSGETGVGLGGLGLGGVGGVDDGESGGAEVGGAAAQEPEPVSVCTFADHFFEAEVRLALNRPFGQVIDAEAALSLKSLRVLQATSLSGIECLSNVEELTVNPLLTGDITPLASLQELKRLTLRNTYVSDLTPLAGHAKLEQLSVVDSEVASLAGLQDLPALRRLDLSTNPLVDARALSGLSSLEELTLNSVSLPDLEALAGLTELRSLQIRDVLHYPHEGPPNPTDLGPLATLDKLELLDASSNQVSDLAPLAELTELKELVLRVNQVTSVAPLAQLPKLRSLDLAFNPLLPQATWVGFPALVRLLFPSCNLGVLPDLSSLPTLEYLDAQSNGLASLVFDAPPTLTTLVLYDPFGDVSGLLAHPQLESLSLGSPAWLGSAEHLEVVMELDLLSLELSEVHGAILDLRGMDRLEELEISGAFALDDAELAAPNLRRVSLRRAQLTNIDFVAGLQRLESLHINEVGVRDISPLVANENFGEGCTFNYEVLPCFEQRANIEALEARGAAVIGECDTVL